MPQKKKAVGQHIYEFEGMSPHIDPSAFVHPLAVVIGDVTVGKKVYVGPGAVLRGDWGKIIIHDGCNVQENCVIHSFPGATTVLEENAHIGHGAILHGPHIGRNVLVGMNAVVMDNARIGNNTIIGALTLIPSEAEIPAGKVVGGSPYSILRDATPAMIEWKTRGTELYQTLPERYRASMKPARSTTGKGKASRRGAAYKTWKETTRKRTKR
jgi:carbonic anhydrase/acetyltransferase-like protein (isoleucine patch superfamily)